MLILTWHPTHALWRDPYQLGTFEIDVNRFQRMGRGQLRPRPKRIVPWPSLRDVKRIYALGLMGVPIACDIETAPAAWDRHRADCKDSCRDHGFTGKDPTQCRLKVIGLGTQEWGLAYWWGRRDGAMTRLLGRLLEDERVIKVFHNGWWFDVRVLARYALPVRSWRDTRDWRRALSATSPLRLAYLASLADDCHPWKEGEGEDAKGLVYTKDRRKLLEYNCYDCVETARVDQWEQTEPDVKVGRVQRIYNIQMEKSRIAGEMHSHGIRVDRRMMDWMTWACTQEFAEKSKALRQAVGIRGFKCNPNHLRALIYRKHAVGNYTKFARFQLPDPVDKEMYSDPKHPDKISVKHDALTLLLIDPDTPPDLRNIIRLYWKASEIKKRKSTYLTSKKVLRAIGRDGRLRAGWNSCGTDTYRFSCSDPNLMQIEDIMRAIYACDPGNVVIGADFRQLELRVMAAVAVDRVLAKALATGDVYSEDAKAWFGLPASMNVKKVKPQARQICKILHLASQYYASLKTVARQAFSGAIENDLELTFDTVAMLFSQFRRTYPDTVAYWAEEHSRVLNTGYSESRILHRRRVYPREPPPTETVNYPIQTTAADRADLALLEIDQKLKRCVPRARLLMQLHDAFYVEARERDAQAVSDIMKEAMEKPVSIGGVKHIFPAEIKIDSSFHMQ